MKEKRTKDLRLMFTSAVSIFTLACFATIIFIGSSPLVNFLWSFIIVGVLASLATALLLKGSVKLHERDSNRAGWVLEILALLLITAAGIVFAIFTNNPI